MVLTFESGCMKSLVAIQMKAIQVLIFECVDEILKCDHSSESHWVEYVPEVLFIMLYKGF